MSTAEFDRRMEAYGFRPAVVLIDDDPQVLSSLTRALSPLPLRIHAFTDPGRALVCVGTHTVGVILSDCRMPSMSGTELLERAAVLQPLAGRVLISGYSTIQMGVDAINRGAAAGFLTKPWEEAEIWSTVLDLAARSVRDRFLAVLAPFLAGLLDLAAPRDMICALQDFLWNELQLNLDSSATAAKQPNVSTVAVSRGGRVITATLSDAHCEIFRTDASRKELLGLVEIAAQATLLAAAERDQEAELEQRAEIDALSGALNRRGFDTMLPREIMRAARYGALLSILFLDIDHFKNFNDSFGHRMADTVIMQLGQLLRSTVRTTDSVARYGGDEFCLILPGVDAVGAIETAQRLQKGVSQIVVAEGAPCIALSVGVTEWRAGLDSCQLVECADRAVYYVKESGRNGIGWFAETGVTRVLPAQEP